MPPTLKAGLRPFRLLGHPAMLRLLLRRRVQKLPRLPRRTPLQRLLQLSRRQLPPAALLALPLPAPDVLTRDHRAI